MKKLILLALTAVIMAGCGDSQHETAKYHTPCWNIYPLSDSTLLAVPKYKQHAPTIIFLKEGVQEAAQKDVEQLKEK